MKNNFTSRLYLKEERMSEPHKKITCNLSRQEEKKEMNWQEESICCAREGEWVPWGRADSQKHGGTCWRRGPKREGRKKGGGARAHKRFD